VLATELMGYYRKNAYRIDGIIVFRQLSRAIFRDHAVISQKVNEQVRLNYANRKKGSRVNVEKPEVSIFGSFFL
jgi:lactam utilization protein B